jgi:hypothetical protein
MRGSLVLLLLVIGWVIMYLVLTLSIPENLRKQTDHMPGTRKAGPLVGPEDGRSPQPETKASSAIALRAIAPEGVPELGLVILQIYRETPAGPQLEVDTSLLITKPNQGFSITVAHPEARYTVRAVAQGKGKRLSRPIALEGLRPGGPESALAFQPPR